jgi:hypothetical protein
MAGFDDDCLVDFLTSMGIIEEGITAEGDHYYCINRKYQNLGLAVILGDAVPLGCKEFRRPELYLTPLGVDAIGETLRLALKTLDKNVIGALLEGICHGQEAPKLLCHSHE